MRLVANASDGDGGLDDGIGWSVVGCGAAGDGGALGAAAPVDRHDGAPVDQERVGLSRRFYSCVGIVTLFSLGNSSDLFLVFYGMLRFDLGLQGLIGLWIVLHLSRIVFSLPGRALSDRLDRRLIIVLGWLVYAAVYAGFALMTQPWRLTSLGQRDAI